MFERYTSNRICIPCNLDLMTWCNTGKRISEYVTLLFHGTVGVLHLNFRLHAKKSICKAKVNRYIKGKH